jgi:hypothetical protein
MLWLTKPSASSPVKCRSFASRSAAMPRREDLALGVVAGEAQHGAPIVVIGAQPRERPERVGMRLLGMGVVESGAIGGEDAGQHRERIAVRLRLQHEQRPQRRLVVHRLLHVGRGERAGLDLRGDGVPRRRLVAQLRDVLGASDRGLRDILLELLPRARVGVRPLPGRRGQPLALRGRPRAGVAAAQIGVGLGEQAGDVDGPSGIFALQRLGMRRPRRAAKIGVEML